MFLTLATRLKHLKRVLNIHNAFETLAFLALLDYVSRALEIEIRPSSVVRRPSVCPSVASIISDVIAWISFKF